MFEKNLSALVQRNPELVKKIREFETTEKDNIKVYETESKNYIIAYKDIMLHSVEDPMREAKALWHKTVKTELREQDIQVIYGIGLGYLFKRAYVNAPSKIVVYEPNLEILRFVMENVDLASEINDSRVTFVGSEEEAIEFFEKKYIPGDKIEFLFLPSYLNFYKNDLVDFSSKVYQAVKDKNIDKNTIALLSKTTTSNLLNRIKNLRDFSSVNCLENIAENKPALIISAGPSIKKDIELIKKNQDKFIKIAILPAVSYLLENQVVPDFVAVADSTNQMFKIEKIKDEMKNMNLVLESRSDYSLDSVEFKNRYVYIPFVDRISAAVIDKMNNSKIGLLPSSSSVSVLALEFAKLLGAKIIFTGLDLAFVDNQMYASSDIKVAQKSGNTLTLAVDGVGAYNVQTTTIKSASGKDIETREDYLFHLREMERICKENPDLEIINTSLEGALIQGMTYKAFEDIIPEKNLELDMNNLPHDFDSISKFSEQAKKMFDNSIIEFEDISSKVESSIKALQVLIDELSKKEPDNDTFQELFSSNKSDFSQVRSFITQDYLLGACMQSQIVDFLNSYHRSRELTVAQVRENFEIEQILFKEAQENIKMISSIISEK